MLYCCNPSCADPFNPENTRFCLSCGSQIFSEIFRHRYHVIRLLGEGGFGRTYEARDIDRMNSPCVIKQFVPQIKDTAALEKAKELFKQEAKRLYELGEHPQIPRLLAYFEQDRRLYLVQEMIEGQTLAAELEEQGTFGEEKIKQLLLDILPVLKFVHDRYIIHRDIKPENIMRRWQDGRLMLIDFGVSKEMTGTILGRGTLVGTPGYAPIEQLRGQVYPASDLYSLGVTCIRLMTGCLPESDSSDRLFDPLNGRWRWRELLPPQTKISPQLASILNKLIQEYVKYRYQSVDRVLAVLNPKLIPLLPQESLLSKKLKPSRIQATASKLQVSLNNNLVQLKNFLSNQKWKEANQETVTIILKLSDCILENTLTEEDIQKIPSPVICTIDQLWLNYSKGRFGFSVQKQIWENLGGNQKKDYENWCRFGDRVGWRVTKGLFTTQTFWLSPNEMNFSLNAPKGHFPRIAYCVSLLSRQDW